MLPLGTSGSGIEDGDVNSKTCWSRLRRRDPYSLQSGDCLFPPSQKSEGLFSAEGVIEDLGWDIYGTVESEECHKKTDGLKLKFTFYNLRSLVLTLIQKTGI